MAKKRALENKSGDFPTFRERLSRSLDIPPDTLPGATFIEIRGRNSLTLKGGKKILTYTPYEIRVSLKKGSLRICGSRLQCTSYYVGAIGIDGFIKSVCFEDGEGE